MSESTKHDAIYLQLCDDEDSEWCDTVTWSKYREHEYDVKYIRADLVESLRQQLAAALAACKLKHNALHFANEELRMYAEEDGDEGYNSPEITGALAIHPDDSALQAFDDSQLDKTMLRGALELVMRHVAISLPTEVCRVANDALAATEPRSTK